jgi:hypothetical protein
MEAEFKVVRAEIKSLDQRITTEAADTRQHFDTLDQRITSEGVHTRQHFDVVAEHFKEYTKALADGIARSTERLDAHDKRITALERRRL